MQFEKLTERFSEQAADLAVRQFASVCEQDPAYRPDAFSVPDLSRVLVEIADSGVSVVAHEKGQVAGFIAGRFINWYGDNRAIYSPEWAHAAGSSRSMTDMYAWLGRDGQFDGSSLHAIGTYASDSATRSALTNLEFGNHQIEGVFTDTSPAANPDAEASVRAATPDDLPDIISLDRQLWQHLATPPTQLDLDLANYPDNNPKYQIPRDGSYICVAEISGRVVGFMSCRTGTQESEALRDHEVPHINGAFVAPEHRNSGVAQALLNDIFRWSTEMNAPRVTVDFESANIEAAGFWLSRKFKPLAYGMTRRTR